MGKLNWSGLKSCGIINQDFQDLKDYWINRIEIKIP